jgi:flagellar protein FlbD
MIKLHRLNGVEVVVNAELIETVEGHPDTVIGLATGNRFVVQESVAEVVQRVVEYRKTVYVGASYLPSFLRGEDLPAGRQAPISQTKGGHRT